MYISIAEGVPRLQTKVLKLMIVIILINIVAIPIVALLDYHFLHDHVEVATGKPVGQWFWLWPCVLELGLFNAGISLGMCLA